MSKLVPPWRALPHMRFTFCARCREWRYCAGFRRDAMRCRECYEAPAARKAAA